MSGIYSFLHTVGDNVVSAFRNFGFLDAVDILVVTVLLFYLFCFIRNRRAGKLALGICMLLLAQVISDMLKLRTMLFLMDYIFQVGVVALVIIFQPELRSVLEKMGGESLSTIRNFGTRDMTRTINELCTACCTLAKDKLGALIVLERSTRLGDIISSGTTVDAEISAPLLCNIFQDKAPLHDGAVVIRDGRVYAAGCFLPLSSNSHILRNLGTRHHSAIGMSENSDAVIIVVSEESGTISVAANGNLTRNYDYVGLQRELIQQLGEHRRTPAEQKGLLARWKYKCAQAKEASARQKEIGVAGHRQDRIYRWIFAGLSLLITMALWVFSTTISG